MNTMNVIYIAAITIVYATAFMQRPFTPFRIENSKMVTSPLLICAHDVGDFNEIRCRNRIVVINNNLHKYANKNVSLPLIIKEKQEDRMDDGEVPWDFDEVDDGDISWWDFGDDEEDDGNSTVINGYSIKPKPIMPNVLSSHVYVFV
jgi:hypothetical protein